MWRCGQFPRQHLKNAGETSPIWKRRTKQKHCVIFWLVRRTSGSMQPQKRNVRHSHTCLVRENLCRHTRSGTDHSFWARILCERTDEGPKAWQFALAEDVEIYQET